MSQDTGGHLLLLWAYSQTASQCGMATAPYQTVKHSSEWWKLPKTSQAPSPTIENIYHKSCLGGARNKDVMDASHPNHGPLTLLPSGGHYRSLRSRTSRKQEELLSRGFDPAELHTTTPIASLHSWLHCILYFNNHVFCTIAIFCTVWTTNTV